jgi:hypothetical protein
MPQAAIPLIGAAAGLGSTLIGANEASRNRNIQTSLANRLASVGFDPNAVIDEFGTGVAFDEQGRPIFSQGQFGPINQALGLGAVGDVSQGSALQQQAINADPFSQNLADLSRIGGFSMQDIVNGRLAGFSGDQGAGDRAFGLANLLGSEATTGFNDLRSDTLSRLDALARPAEERAFAGLQDNLFATGRLGSTGGALQTEAFARGLGDAATARSLQADQVARDARQQAIQGFGQASDVGTQLRVLEDDLYQNALGRFGSTLGLQRGLLGERFNQGGSLFNQGLAGLTGQQSILETLLGMGQFGANLGAQEASTALGAAGGAANVPLGVSGNQVLGTGLATLGGNILADPGGFSDSVSSVFGKNSTPSAPAPNTTRPGGK